MYKQYNGKIHQFISDRVTTDEEKKHKVLIESSHPIDRKTRWVGWVLEPKQIGCTGRSALRSSSSGDFLIHFARTATKQRRAFSIVGPTTWNDLLPSFLRLSH